MYKIEEYKKLLKSKLTEKRYHHSLCVADEAVVLAKLYGADEKKAYLAGLLHDITKNASKEEHFELFNKYNVKLDEVEQSSEKLWHALSGACYVENVLEIKDKEIISAIKFHTTAKANLSTLEAVIYLADFSSADRDYDDVDVMRELAHTDMKKALAYALSYTIKELVEKQVRIHKDTFFAYNDIMEKGDIK